ncbi:LuxR family transcriptional regulator [Mycobacterium simiae]|uniref:LuxR family transcriptional regulator n=1 Tax=Mycobacterium simiae TaxID=1784 RepID=A0A5B1BSD6_MYCSI|nr:LuxR C-terminal-related transcriptional regulator [Mycobacterium simiae]KAA1249979.1 LuxR family transcriptional regulator [Mycobacterium simiae]
MSELLLTGTVTLLLADIEEATRLWQTQPAEMAAAFALLEQTLADAVAAHGGVRPVEHGEGDSVVVAFGRAADAVAAALRLQLAGLAPVRLRIGIHTGDVQLRDDTSYAGPTISRTAALRDLAHGGQTLLSATTSDIVSDELPAAAWLIDVGTQPLRNRSRPERVAQLCHPQLHNDFPPLHKPKAVAVHNLPIQLTNFVGRELEMAEVVRLVTDNRLVTLIGAGGFGKSRLAVQVAMRLTSGFPDGVCYVDLEPITDPDMAPILVARALGLSDQLGRSTADTVLRYLAEREMLIVLDTCEHLLDVGATQVNALLQSCPGVTLLATSREPIKVAGEVTWRVPSLSLDDAIAFFADRARLARPDFVIDDGNAALVSQICRGLDGMPLALELAAARVRSLSLSEIIAGLDDRIRLLTGGARTAPRRHQTLRASLDWSYGLLNEPERILLRRLGVFVGGFDLAAAEAVAGFGDLPRHQVLDELTSLVDKSLVWADSTQGRTRYRRLEGVGQYAMERLHEAAETDTVRKRYCDHYLALAALLDSPGRTDYQRLLDEAEIELDNLRVAFLCCREYSDVECALTLTSSLQPLWLSRGRIREGRSWFQTILAEQHALAAEVSDAVRARALADKAVLDMFITDQSSLHQAQEALAVARKVDDPALLAQALTACGLTAGFSYQPDAVRKYFTEAAGIARSLGDRWRLSQILSWQGNAALVAGDTITARAAGTEGLEVAEAIGDRFGARRCRLSLAFAQLWQGDLAGAVAHFGELVQQAQDADADVLTPLIQKGLGDAHAYRGEVSAARAAGEVTLNLAEEGSEYFLGLGYATLAIAAVAGGDIDAARAASKKAWQNLRVQPHTANYLRPAKARISLASGDVMGARRCADEAASVLAGWHLALALTSRARVAIAQGEPEQAERDAHDALAAAVAAGAQNCVPDTLDCLAGLATEQSSHLEATRFYAAADAMRQRMGAVRFKIYDSSYENSVTALRNALSEKEFDSAWTEGAALTTEEAIAYVQRGRGERRRATSGWASLTPAELEVVNLVGEGLSNKDIAARLFVSPRTVQTHLTHVYTKLDLNSRVQLAQEAARH